MNNKKSKKIELNEIIEAINHIVKKGFVDNPEKLVPNQSQSEIENRIMGSIFLERKESYQIVWFLMDNAVFESFENRSIFYMARELFGCSESINYENLIKELTKHGKLNEKMQSHIEMMQSTYFDEVTLLAISKKFNEIIIFID